MVLPALLDALPDLVVVVGADGRVRDLGRAAQTFLGGRASHRTSLPELAEAVAPGAWSRLRDRLPGTLTGNAQSRCTVELVDGVGQGAPYALTAHAAPGGELVLIARDTTDVRIREAVERESRAKDEFVARLGHELRTPLNAVLGFAQLLELEPLSPELREDVDRIMSGGRHMQALLDDVLDLARVRTGGIDLDVGPVQVLEVVRGVADLLKLLAERRGIRRVIHPADTVAARADRRRLWQVVLNLMGNAVKYGREGGTVRLGIVPVVGGRVRIEVEDDGEGIAPEALVRLFRPFDRLGAERSGVEGSGLGLALSKALVTAMGGVLTAVSRPEVGTVFAVVLDAIDPAAAEPGRPPAAGPPRQVVHATANPSTQTLVAQALRNRLGADAVAVTTSAAAVDAVRRFHPALVLVDRGLPDAADVLRALPADPLTALVPVVVLSDDPDPRERLRLRAAGATEVLDVPLDMRALLEVAGGHLADL